MLEARALTAPQALHLFAGGVSSGEPLLSRRKIYSLPSHFTKLRKSWNCFLHLLVAAPSADTSRADCRACAAKASLICRIRSATGRFALFGSICSPLTWSACSKTERTCSGTSSGLSFVDERYCRDHDLVKVILFTCLSRSTTPRIAATICGPLTMRHTQYGVPRRSLGSDDGRAPIEARITNPPLLDAPGNVHPIGRFEKTRRGDRPGLQALSGAIHIRAPLACKTPLGAQAVPSHPTNPASNGLEGVRPVPVWFVGLSNGAVSAAFVAERLRQAVPTASCSPRASSTAAARQTSSTRISTRSGYPP